jgi:NADPH:quinone reductase-like Zn-dependent oxidoreductase
MYRDSAALFIRQQPEFKYMQSQSLEPKTMNIILGASGQVGSAIVDSLVKANVPVKAVVHNREKAGDLKKKGCW